MYLGLRVLRPGGLEKDSPSAPAPRLQLRSLHRTTHSGTPVRDDKPWTAKHQHGCASLDLIVSFGPWLASTWARSKSSEQEVLPFAAVQFDLRCCRNNYVNRLSFFSRVVPGSDGPPRVAERPNTHSRCRAYSLIVAVDDNGGHAKITHLPPATTGTEFLWRIVRRLAYIDLYCLEVDKHYLGHDELSADYSERFPLKHGEI